MGVENNWHSKSKEKRKDGGKGRREGGEEAKEEGRKGEGRNSIDQWHSVTGSFDPRGCVAMSGGMFGCPKGQRGVWRCYWNLVGGGQGYSKTSCNTQDSHSHRGIIQPQC